MEMDAYVRAGRGAVATAGRWRGDGQRPDSAASSGTRWRLALPTKRTPGVAGVVGSGAKQHPRVLPRPNVSGQAHAFSFWSSSPMSKMASSEKRSCSLLSRAAEEPRAGPGAGASSGEAQGGLAPTCVEINQ